MKTLSIITVVYNGQEVLEPTLRSVAAQSYPDIEYIVIDGASKDKTPDILEKHRNIITHLVSEPDDGIYDAMNKGLDLATGNYVLFLNAGDSLIDPEVVEKVMSLPEADIYYGETMLVDDDRNHLGTRSKLTTRKLPVSLSWKSLKDGLVVSHQSIMVKKDIAPKYMMGNLSADIDWVIRSLKASQSTLRYPGIISEFLIGGISDQKKLRSWRDRFIVLSHHYGLLTAIWLHLRFITRWMIK